MEIHIQSEHHKDRLDRISYTWTPDKSMCFISVGFKERGFDIYASGSGNMWKDSEIPYKSLSFHFYDTEGKELESGMEIFFVGLSDGRFYYSHDKRDMDIVYVPYEHYDKIFNETNMILNSKDIYYGTQD